MLDDSSPHARHVHEAGRVMSGIYKRAKEMTVTSTARRVELLGECLTLASELRLANEDHFKRPTIVDLLHELELALQVLADVDTGDPFVDAKSCPGCGGPIRVIQPNEYLPTLIERYCPQCFTAVRQALNKLESVEAFGTVLI